ncbi:efflux RND transporter periplasmic adaptor subunit [Pseudomonas stutzeri]|uniref:RND transporter n=1 Tax=Stutzerimonas stutzeri KOS6 TaxID=1218352 RepID=A0A061JRP4_STUST|nr:efflux RND transporter periplasmic adaptor subunit [Stutzerimonas stutzeri]EWC40854.1 RND transporter [Stutzerimonas stutzeri KOS6]MBK3867333.1 efflux RND transporter periplasmic adaptor subunit [Stutzerimonas stutzeri]
MNPRLKRLALMVSLPMLLSATDVFAVSSHADKPDSDGREVLYWYDPMYPQQQFDKPGKSPFMDMDLVPRYAEEGGDAASIRIDPGIAQNLGMRVATASRQNISQTLDAVGALAFDNRDVALVQARAGGFVERVYDRAPEDVIEKGAPLADLLIPEWGAAQAEYLALRDLGEPGLLAAARQRLRLAGMPAELIARLERTGQPLTTWTVTSPIGGVLQSLEVREGMTLTAGATLARVNGLDTVWLEVAVPEAQAAGLSQGQPVQARLPAFPGEPVEGRIQAVLPLADLQSRTVRVRVELPNPEQRLRPGMTAEVTLNAEEQLALVVPTEAVIRTGKRSIVMLAEANGRYRPVGIRTGREAGDFTVVLEGLEEGQQVVASGQFLLDSEASLRGITAQAVSAPAIAGPALHEAEGTIVEIDGDMVGLSHGPFKTLGMPGMTMPFPVANMVVLEGFKAGDRVRVGVSQTDEGLFIERLEKLDEHAGHGGHQP